MIRSRGLHEVRTSPLPPDSARSRIVPAPRNRVNRSRRLPWSKSGTGTSVPRLHCPLSLSGSCSPLSAESRSFPLDFLFDRTKNSVSSVSHRQVAVFTRDSTGTNADASRRSASVAYQVPDLRRKNDWQGVIKRTINPPVPVALRPCGVHTPQPWSRRRKIALGRSRTKCRRRRLRAPRFHPSSDEVHGNPRATNIERRIKVFSVEFSFRGNQNQRQQRQPPLSGCFHVGFDWHICRRFAQVSVGRRPSA